MRTQARRLPQAKRARVLLVDDHPVVREGLAQLISRQADLVVCGEAEDVPGALAAIERAKPDLAVVDLSLKGRSALELLKDLRSAKRRPPVLLLSMHDESAYAERALKAGAKGYIMKEETREKLLVAIRRVLAGEIYVSERMTTRILRQVAGAEAETLGVPFERLSDRELEVFRLLGQGRSTRQIAERLNLSVKTIQTYREHLMQKLDLASATELVRRAVQDVEQQRI